VVQYRLVYQDQLRVAALFNGNDELEKRFVYEMHPNVPDYMIYDNQRFLFVKDERGSVLRVVNTDNGETVQELTYDSWGKVLSDTNPGFQPFGFAGGLYDPDTKLVRFRRRASG
jgi:YD repeat-containing protein